MCSCKRLLAQVLPAIRTSECSPRRASKVVASCIGLPVAASIAIAVIVVLIVVAIFKGTERGSCDRACRCDGTTDYGTRCADQPHRPAILIRGRNSVFIAEPADTIGLSALLMPMTLGVGRCLSFIPLAVVPIAVAEPASAEVRITAVLRIARLVSSWELPLL